MGLGPVTCREHKIYLSRHDECWPWYRCPDCETQKEYTEKNYPNLWLLSFEEQGEIKKNMCERDWATLPLGEVNYDSSGNNL